ncbi:hypothetical protein RRG08_038690 [Elysia crispata]|uniref:Uncharacterized protein n=1 Tax=Elysia crispata TaxID=231223 RepID=A0AAE0ZIQ9_9GAST|nr:hypothetical protein RRG08_038690 [Elysia crispata]
MQGSHISTDAWFVNIADGSYVGQFKIQDTEDLALVALGQEDNEMCRMRDLKKNKKFKVVHTKIHFKRGVVASGPSQRFLKLARDTGPTDLTPGLPQFSPLACHEPGHSDQNKSVLRLAYSLLLAIVGQSVLESDDGDGDDDDDDDDGDDGVDVMRIKPLPIPYLTLARVI